MELSNIQREAIRQIRDGLEYLLQSHSSALYGSSDDDLRIELKQYINEFLEKPLHLLDELSHQVKNLENVIKPDETDVHNINRRIEMLAQRVAELESNKKWWQK